MVFDGGCVKRSSPTQTHAREVQLSTPADADPAAEEHTSPGVLGQKTRRREEAIMGDMALHTA